MLKLIRCILLGSIALCTTALAAEPANWIEGQHYFRLHSPQATDLPAGKVEVIEVFRMAARMQLVRAVSASVPRQTSVERRPALRTGQLEFGGAMAPVPARLPDGERARHRRQGARRDVRCDLENA